jgi:hypothetical protein
MNNYLVSAGYLPCKTRYRKVTHLTRFPPVSVDIEDNIFSSDDDTGLESDNQESFIIDTIPVEQKNYTIDTIPVEHINSFVIPVKYNKQIKVPIKNDTVKFEHIAESVCSFVKNIHGL